jgi:hypothetical protein
MIHDHMMTIVARAVLGATDGAITIDPTPEIDANTAPAKPYALFGRFRSRSRTGNAFR